MLVLKSLSFENIGRFVESQTIDFTQLNSLIQIEGVNNNTGGSSGAGKSTIFKSLEFLLGLNDVSNTVLQSRLTKDAMSVTGLFELDGVPLKIQRGKKLLIDLGGEVTTGSSKLTEEKLDQILGMPRDLFRKILVKRQGEQGFFLNMTPSEVHKFLTSCLGLQLEQAKVLTLDTRLTTLIENETSLKSSVQSNQMGLEATQSAISSLGPTPTLDIDPEAIKGLQTRYAGAIDNHQLVREGHKRELEDLEKSRPQISTIPFDRSGIVSLENGIGTILAKISKLESLEKDRQQAAKNGISELQIAISDLNRVEQSRQYGVKTKLSDNRARNVRVTTSISKGNEAKVDAAILAKELQKVRASLCPTCEQSWITDAAKAKEASILSKLQEHRKAVMLGSEAAKELIGIEEEKKLLILEDSPRINPELEPINTKIAQLRMESEPQAIPEAIELKLQTNFKNQELVSLRKEERDHQFKESTRSQDILAIFAQKQTELRLTHENAIQYVRSEESKALSEYESAMNRVSSFEESKKRFEQSLRKLEEQAFLYQDQLLGKTEGLARVQEEIELAQELKKAIKSYLSASFEDALDSIGDQATKLIRSIPNMETATIQFEGLKESASSGKIKEEVNCTISVDGEIGIPIKSLSGGERSSVDIGIDLSVIRFIEERTGNGIDLFILDEFTNGLDTTCIESAIEMLKIFSIDKRLFLVEHNQIAAQSIENRLTVVRDGLTSKIVQQ